jgi:Domain of unknown function (DUF4136)
MSVTSKQLMQLVILVFVSVSVASCVTETIESPSIKFNETAVISVGDPNASVVAGSTFAWLPEAVRFYDDERLDNAPIKLLIETEIVKNLKNIDMVFVESKNGAKYAIAYTAALESSLDDAAIIRRFGLLPGMAQVPQGDANVEKGSLIIYVFENRTGDIIWRSAAQIGVKFDLPIEQRKERVIRVVAEMFQTFPTAVRGQIRAQKKATEKLSGDK